MHLEFIAGRTRRTARCRRGPSGVAPEQPRAVRYAGAQRRSDPLAASRRPTGTAPGGSDASGGLPTDRRDGLTPRDFSCILPGRLYGPPRQRTALRLVARRPRCRPPPARRFLEPV